MRFPLAVALAASFGALCGLSTFALVHEKGLAYLSKDPLACARCHVMQEHYDGWIKSSHSKVASCNDCHARSDLVGGLLDTGASGVRHTAAFALDRVDDPLRARESTREIVEAACRRCHAGVAAGLLALACPVGARPERSCIHCHGSVGHMGVTASGTTRDRSWMEPEQ